MPELEAWESVIITGNNGNIFLSSVHGPDYDGTDHHPLACQYCHSGQADGTFTTMDEAHVGLIPDPSATGPSGCTACHDGTDGVGIRSACDGCHADIVTRTATSLHSTQQGYFTAIEHRGGEFGGAVMEEFFDARCAGCHTTCGQCHVSRPQSVGGGFLLTGGISLSAHRFRQTPDMNEQCTACHGTRVGDDYKGTLTGTPDVHFSRGRNCMYCHSGDEIHGDGTQYEHRYEVANMPRCEDCHSDDVQVAVDPGTDCNDCHVEGNLDQFVFAAADVHHAHHTDTSNAECTACHGEHGIPGAQPPNMQCQACHSQPYKNCTNCHNHSVDGAHGYDIDTPTIQFKIARNPSQYRQEYDVAVVRHIPVDPDTYANWGLSLPDYTSKSTWMYSSPHNVIKNTAQTAAVEGQSCAYSCHQSPSGPDGFLLREADLYEEDGVTPLVDYGANIDYVIPAGWPAKK